MPQVCRDKLGREVMEDLIDAIIADQIEDISKNVTRSKLFFEWDRSAMKVIYKKDFINSHKHFLETQAKSVMSIDGELESLINERQQIFKTRLEGNIIAEISLQDSLYIDRNILCLQQRIMRKLTYLAMLLKMCLQWLKLCNQIRAVKKIVQLLINSKLKQVMNELVFNSLWKHSSILIAIELKNSSSNPRILSISVRETLNLMCIYSYALIAHEPEVPEPIRPSVDSTDSGSDSQGFTHELAKTNELGTTTSGENPFYIFK